MKPYFYPDEKSAFWRRVLIGCGIVHFILAIMMMFISPTKGMYEMIDIAILACSLARLDFCCLILYILNCTVQFFQNFNMIGLAVQEGSLGSLTSSFAASLIMMFTIYYVAAIVASFYGYRSFKFQMQ